MTSESGTQRYGKPILASLLLLMLSGSLVQVGANFIQSARLISTSGTVIYEPRVNVTLNFGRITHVNNLSLGFILDSDWKHWRDSIVNRELSREANFRLIRVYDFRHTDPPLMPVTEWNESAKTGAFNWTNVDTLVQEIFATGAEPFFCLGWARANITNYLPPGMAVNPSTELPYPDSYAAYAAAWVRHFKTLGWPVRFYELFNEPFYLRLGTNYTRLNYFKDVWNITARAMRAANPKVMLSFCYITAKKVLDYWIEHGDSVDYLDVHKYEAHELPGYDDQEIFSIAETKNFEDDYTFYGFSGARQKWLAARGKLLPAIISESNLNSAYENGTDTRIQQIEGAVRLSLVLRKAILSDVNYHVYYFFSSSIDSHTGSFGFGMVNSKSDHPWIPYYVQQIFGNNLGIGDSIIETTSSSEDIRPLAWIHEGKAKILLVCKIDESRTVNLQGVTGQFSFFRIDSTTSILDPQVRTGVVDSSIPLRLNGYTVMLLQTASA